MANIKLHFLPYFKKNLGEYSLESGSIKSTFEMTLQYGANKNSITGFDDLNFNIEWRGPKDILGFNKKVISRTEPVEGRSDFEPNYFPFVEFKDPDFPWRYSLDFDYNESQIDPWLSLIVLDSEEIGSSEFSITKNQEFIKIDKDLLPDPETLWANAHVQLVETSPGSIGTDFHKFIENNPSRSCSRLFCLRKLKPSTSYTAIIIPNYPFLENETLPEKVILPVFYKWTFFTSEGGDFEELARRLNPSITSIIGTKTIDASLLNKLDDSGIHSFMMEGAVISPDSLKYRNLFNGYKVNLPDYLYDNNSGDDSSLPLLKVLNTSLELYNDDSVADPLVSSTVYGRYFKNTTLLEMPNNDNWNSWTDELNLDLRNRVAASFGTTVIQRKQEEYMQECWSQVGEIRKANEKLRLIKAGYSISERIKNNYIDNTSFGLFLRITSPFHSHFKIKTENNLLENKSVSIKKYLLDTGIRENVTSYKFSKIAKRFIGKTKIETENLWHPVAQLYTPISPDPSPVNPISPLNNPRPKPRPVDDIPTRSLTPGSNQSFRKVNIEQKHTKQIADFNTEFKTFLPLDDLLNNEYICDTKEEFIEVKPLEEKDKVSIVNAFDIKKVLLDKICIKNKDQFVTINQNFDTILAAPRIVKPMYRELCDISKDFIVPGIDKVDYNSVSLLQENRRFIESYMCGVNHEMNNELVWRDYPTDRRGTVFSYFWQPAQVSESNYDIKEIHQWDNTLGKNTIVNSQNSEPKVVLLIKGDLIRRYPAAIFYAMKLKYIPPPKEKIYWSDYGEGSPDSSSLILTQPSFRANIGYDILLVGFDLSITDLHPDDGEYYFVIQEASGLPRFGLDVGSIQTRTAATTIATSSLKTTYSRKAINSSLKTTKLDLTTSSLKTTKDDLKWSDVQLIEESNYIIIDKNSPMSKKSDNRYNSAGIAYNTIQKPIRIVIHQSEMLPNNVGSDPNNVGSDPNKGGSNPNKGGSAPNNWGNTPNKGGNAQ